jgi:hypothetical protein
MSMKASSALLELFKDEQVWRQFFRSCCETGTHRLMAQAWQFGDELKERGNRFLAEEVEVALLGLARDLLPESVAAGWDAEWAHELCKDALAHLAEHHAVLSAEETAALNLSGPITASVEGHKQCRLSRGLGMMFATIRSTSFRLGDRPSVSGSRGVGSTAGAIFIQQRLRGASFRASSPPLIVVFTAELFFAEMVGFVSFVGF